MAEQKGEYVKAKGRPAKGFYRCGVYWPANGAVHGPFTADQLERLRNETMIAVQGVNADPSKLADRKRATKPDKPEAAG